MLLDWTFFVSELTYQQRIGFASDAALGCCVNQDCNAPLRPFGSGRFFEFEIVSISLSACDDKTQPFDEKPHSQTLQFWLCESCAHRMTLVLAPVGGLRTISLAECCEVIPPVSGGNTELVKTHNC